MCGRIRVALALVALAGASPAAAQDADGDLALDAVDACPAEAETYDGASDTDGCPEPGTTALVRVTATALELVAPPRFEIDSDELRPDAFATLTVLASLLLSHPELGLVRIEGHMDPATAREREHMSRRLWLDRARAVLDFLVSRGVPRARLEAASFVTDAPRCDPATVPRRRRRACRAENDRIVVRRPPAPP